MALHIKASGKTIKYKEKELHDIQQGRFLKVYSSKVSLMEKER